MKLLYFVGLTAEGRFSIKNRQGGQTRFENHFSG